MLEGTIKLASIDLSHNININDEVCFILAHLFKSLVGLKKVVLSHTACTEKGLALMIAALT
jgi:hypothetical protein